MSVVTASDMVSTNLLSEMNLNPVWEKYRGYLFAGSFVTSLFPFYMTLNGVDIHCVPVHYSTTGKNQSGYCTEIGELSVAQTAFVNSLCATDENLWFQRYAGDIMLGITIGIQILSSFWLHVKSVKDGIQTFSYALDKFLKLGLSKDETIALCSTPLKGMESEHINRDEALENLKPRMEEADYSVGVYKTVREVIRLFAYHKPENSIFNWYLIRNILLILMISSVAGWLIWNMTLTEQWSKDFRCTTDDGSAILFEEFVCTSSYGETILVYLGVYLGTVIVQLCLVILATCICYTWGDIRNLLNTPCAEECNRSPGILIRFWESASPVQSGLFKAIIKHIHSLDFEKDLKENMKSICENEDYELIRIKSKLFGDTSEVISTLCGILCSEIPFDHHLILNMSIRAVKYSQYALNKDVRKIITEFFEEMKIRCGGIPPELIVAILKNCDNEHDIAESVVRKIIPLDARSIKSSQILYFAFSKEYLRGPHKSVAAKALFRGEDENNLKINHKTLRRYLNEIYSEDGEVDKILEECGIIRQIPSGAPSPVEQSSPLIERVTSV